MTDAHPDFLHLQQFEAEGTDFSILIREGASGIVVAAPHAGGIEPGTGDIADAIAGAEHGFYAFSGLKKRGNAVLHIASTRFDEPRGIRMVRCRETAVVVHGCRGRRPVVRIGGRNQHLRRAVAGRLAAAGFVSETGLRQALAGMHPDNFCNRCRSGRGLQLELSRGLREQLLGSFSEPFPPERSEAFARFVACVREALTRNQ